MNLAALLRGESCDVGNVQDGPEAVHRDRGVPERVVTRRLKRP